MISTSVRAWSARVPEASTLRSGVARHRLFVLALGLAVVLRVATAAAYRPVLWFSGDSFEYLGLALRLQPDPVRPIGYPLLLRLLEPLPHSLACVVALQHLLGLAVAVLLYALLVHIRLPPWGATLAALPPLFDAYQVQLEHLVMSDVAFQFLLVAAVVLLLWSRRPRASTAALAGLLLGAAALTRTIGLVLAVVLLLALVVRRAGIRAVAAAAVAATLPVAGYLTWAHTVHGRWALTTSDGLFLYSRTMRFADCERLPLTPDERRLCDRRPPEQRPPSSAYLWHPSVLDVLPRPLFSPANNDLAGGFARTAIRHQPVDYLRVVTADVARTFAAQRVAFPSRSVVRKYRFSLRPPRIPGDHVLTPWARRADVAAYEGNTAPTRVDPRFARALVAYQRVGHVPGPLTGVLVLVGLAGWAARRGRDIGHPGGALTAVGCALLVVPPMVAQFDHRYVVPALPLLAAGAAAGLASARCRPAPGSPPCPRSLPASPSFRVRQRDRVGVLLARRVPSR